VIRLHRPVERKGLEIHAPRLWPRGALWRDAEFLKLWAAQAISQLGTQVTLLALPLAAILVLDATATEVALLGAVEVLPFLLFTLPAGVWVDRLPRRPILVVADLARAVALASIPLAYALDALTLPHLYVVAFTAGVLSVFFDVSYLAYLPSLVDRSRLGDANSKLEATRSAAQVAGPGTAGGLVGAFTAPVAILVDAASYLLSAVFLWRIRRQDRREPDASPRGKLWPELREGLSYVLGHRYLRPLTLVTGSWNLFASVGFGISLVYFVRPLGLSPEVVGVLLTVGGCGSVAGALLAGRAAARFGIGPTMVWPGILASVMFVFVPLAPRENPELFIVASVLLGTFFGMLFNVTQLTFRQAITPERLQGRMNAVVRLMYWGPQPAGLALGGVLAAAIGLRPTLFVSAGAATLCFLPLAAHPIRKLHAMPGTEQGPSPAPAVAPIPAPHQPDA
jgi:MFS family permease